MNPTKKLILKELATQRLTARDLADLIGCTVTCINDNIASLKRDDGFFIVICDWEQTGGRGRPLYKLSKINLKDVPEPRRRDEKQSTQRKYFSRSALISRKLKKKRDGFTASPWDGFQDIARERARS